MNDQTEHTREYHEETWRNRPVKFTVAELDERARFADVIWEGFYECPPIPEPHTRSYPRPRVD